VALLETFMNTTERVYWQPPGGPTMTAEIPIGKPSFGINAECWHCPGSRVGVIDRKAGHYECTAPHRHPIPQDFRRVTRDGKAIDIYEHGARLTRIEGTPHTP
jgi:hypothetical protein